MPGSIGMPVVLVPGSIIVPLLLVRGAMVPVLLFPRCCWCVSVVVCPVLLVRQCCWCVSVVGDSVLLAPGAENKKPETLTGDLRALFYIAFYMAFICLVIFYYILLTSLTNLLLNDLQSLSDRHIYSVVPETM
jgi:hypothetical protein